MTTTYLIAEVAERTGYSPATLRYYEDIGLLPRAERSANGYRVYDEGTLERLAFITRAKQLGCSLEETAELVGVWEVGECAPVQHGLRAVIDAKVSEAQSRIGELTALVADLRRVTAGLDRHTPDGPCDDRCGCNGTTGSGIDATPMTFTIATAAREGDVPIACSLGVDETGDRLDEWNALLATNHDPTRGVTARLPLDDGIRLEFGPNTDVGEIARLAAAEQSCCGFFSFTLVIDQRGPALEVRAPADGQDVLTAVFGPARSPAHAEADPAGTA